MGTIKMWISQVVTTTLGKILNRLGFKENERGVVLPSGKCYLLTDVWLCLILYSDYLKFTLPLAHSLALIAWGGIEWYDGYARANQTSQLHDTLRWGTDWLMKAHPDANTLYVQVGSGNVDNNYWGKPYFWLECADKTWLTDCPYFRSWHRHSYAKTLLCNHH